MSSKLFRLLAIAAAALVAVGVAVVISSSNAEPDPKPAAGDAARDAVALVEGIPEQDGVLGDPKAPITVTEFVDLQCPVCAAAAQQVLPTVLTDHVRTGKVKLAMRTLYFLGPDSERAARVAAGAEQQGRLWAFVEAFYARQGQENSGYVTDEFLRETAAAAKVDADAALAQTDTEFASDRLQRADADAATHGVSGTPTFVIEREGEAPQTVDAGTLLAELQR